MTVNLKNKTPPSEHDQLSIKGLSLLFFDYYKLRSRANINTLKAEPILTDNDYLSIFDLDPADLKRQAFYRCVDALPVPPTQLRDAGIAQGTARLIFRLMDDAFVLAVTVVNVYQKAGGGLFKGPHVEPQYPLKTADVLQLIRELNEVSAVGFRYLQQQRRRMLEDVFGPEKVEPYGETRSRKNVGIQIWSIGNTLAPKIDGVDLTVRFAWELAGLLECGSDIFLNDLTAWRNLRSDQVEQLISRGTAILADHQVLTHRSVCLEISQVDQPKLGIRSANRLAAYGFDSTSLYLWGIAAAQESVLISFHDQLSEELRRVESLFGGELTPAASKDALRSLVSTKIALYRSLDSAFWLTSRMREQRHTTFFTETEEAWGLRAIRHELEQKLDALSELSAEIHRLLA